MDASALSGIGTIVVISKLIPQRMIKISRAEIPRIFPLEFRKISLMSFKYWIPASWTRG